MVSVSRFYIYVYYGDFYCSRYMEFYFRGYVFVGYVI